MDKFNEYRMIEDTLLFWYANRIKGISVSMCPQGDINMQLLKAFDRIAIEVVKEENYGKV